MANPPGAEPSRRILRVGGAALHVTFERGALERNWSLTHEMVHLAFPSVPEAHHWAEEGLATFVEPTARARIGRSGSLSAGRAGARA